MPQKEVGIQIGSLPLFGAGLGEGIKLENYHIYLVSQDFEFVPDLAVWACEDAKVTMVTDLSMEQINKFMIPKEKNAPGIVPVARPRLLKYSQLTEGGKLERTCLIFFFFLFVCVCLSPFLCSSSASLRKCAYA
ncbi:MAG TPA: hypothetical protein V6C97_27455 [Oculatellaceae cyanobacterium]